MNTKLGLAILVVVLAVVGWYAYTNYTDRSLDTEEAGSEEAIVSEGVARNTGEGGAGQDTVLVVSETAVGKWQSTEDAKFVREFKADGKVADWYNNEIISEGSWKVFTKEKPLSVSFPVETSAVYVQMTTSGTQADNLNFKVVKLTDSELVLIYMDRGGSLSFKRIQ